MQSCISLCARYKVLSSCLRKSGNEIVGELCKDHCELLFLTQALTRCLLQNLLKMMGVLELGSVNFGLCFDCVFALFQHHIRIWTIPCLFGMACDRVLTTLEFNSTIEVLWIEFVEAGLIQFISLFTFPSLKGRKENYKLHINKTTIAVRSGCCFNKGLCMNHFPFNPLHQERCVHIFYGYS